MDTHVAGGIRSVPSRTGARRHPNKDTPWITRTPPPLPAVPRADSPRHRTIALPTALRRLSLEGPAQLPPSSPPTVLRTVSPVHPREWLSHPPRTPSVTIPTIVSRPSTPSPKNTAAPTATPPAISAAPATTTPSAPSAPAWDPWRSPSTPGWLWACVPSR